MVYLVSFRVKRENGVVNTAEFELGGKDSNEALEKAWNYLKKQCGDDVEVASSVVKFLGTDQEMIDKYNKFN